MLHVVDNILTRAYGAEGFVLADPELQGEIEASAREQVDALLFDEDRDVLRPRGGRDHRRVHRPPPSSTYARDAAASI